MAKEEWYPIIWAEASALFETRKKIMLGICGYSNRVCKVASPKDALTIFVVNNLYISNDQCEEGLRCLDFDCTFNKTTRESFAHAYGYKPKSLGTFGRLNFNMEPDGSLRSFKDVVGDSQTGTIILSKSRGHK